MLVFLQTLVRGYCGFQVFDMALIVDRGVVDRGVSIKAEPGL